MDGAFTIACNASTEIAISYIGYATYKLAIKDCSIPVKIELQALSNKLEDVEITATSSQNKSLLFQPESIAKLDETEIKRGNGLFLMDAINNNVPGVTMQTRGVASGQQFNIRGYGNGISGSTRPNSNFDSQGLKAYLNGIPLTDAEGITLFDDIDFGSIGNVEIIKGPSGTLYGLAAAGVVNLTTIEPEKGKTSVGQDVMLGSYALQRFTTHFATSTDHSSLLINYGKQTTDGYALHTASHKDFVNLSANFQPNDKQTITTYFGYSNSYDQRGGELTMAQFANKDYSGNPDYIKRNGHSEIISFRAGVGHTYRFSSHVSNTTSVFGSGMINNSSSAAGWTDKDPINYGLRSTLDLKFTLGQGITLGGITGIETQRQNAQTIGYNMVANPTDPNAYWILGAMKSNQYTINSTSSLFSEWTLSLPHDLSITAGLGSSHMSIQLNDRFYVATSTNPTQYNKNYDGMMSPHVAVNKVINKTISLYASYSKGYKAPVSSYFFIPSTGQVNTGLRPEIGNQFEIGSKGSVFNESLIYELALFDAQFSDKMTAIAVPLSGSSTIAYTYVANAGKQHDQGIEFLLKYTAYKSTASFIKTIRPFGNLAYSNFKYVGYSFQTLNAARTAPVIANYDGNAVAGVSPVTANIGIDIDTKPGIYANAVYAYKDAMPITSDGLNKTSSYALLNAKAGFRKSFSKNIDIDIFFGINNIAGVQYANMVFVNQVPDVYLAGPSKANYFGGINFKYNL